MRQAVFDYIKKKYMVSPDYPWKKYAANAVFRHNDNKKWFALVMDVQGDKVGCSASGYVDVINLKIDDMFFRDMIIREAGIMPAYHMNKQHWITILLDGSVPEEKVFDLIDMSFLATASAKKKAKIRPTKEWIVPANPKYYDIIHAFDDNDEIDWKQGAGIRKGDTVFMYAGAPVSAILYKCKVTETDIPYKCKERARTASASSSRTAHEMDGKLMIKALMKIRLQKRYAPESFTFEILKENYGIYAVRGPRGIPNTLSMALKK